MFHAAAPRHEIQASVTKLRGNGPSSTQPGASRQDLCRCSPPCRHSNERPHPVIPAEIARRAAPLHKAVIHSRLHGASARMAQVVWPVVAVIGRRSGGTCLERTACGIYTSGSSGQARGARGDQGVGRWKHSVRAPRGPGSAGADGGRRVGAPQMQAAFRTCPGVPAISWRAFRALQPGQCIGSTPTSLSLPKEAYVTPAKAGVQPDR